MPPKAKTKKPISKTASKTAKTAQSKVGAKSKAGAKPKETELYAPVKSLLEKQGYEVKGEVGKADIVAVRLDADGAEEEPIVLELKTAFSLSLFHQAVDRQSLTDLVYIAVPRSTGRAFGKSLSNNKALCRRLGLGLMTVRLKDGLTEIHLDPAPYVPRKSKIKKTRLLREFSQRVGDPNLGGASRRSHLMTAYRQDALRLLQYLCEHGPTKASVMAKALGVGRARNIMAHDHYGWFERAATEAKGVYQTTPKGDAARVEFNVALKDIAANTPVPNDGPSS